MEDLREGADAGLVTAAAEVPDLIVDVAPEDHWRVIEIMATAFRHDPGFQAVARASGRRRDDRIRAMVTSTLEVHAAGGHPIRGIYREGHLLAVALISRPGSSLLLWPSVRAVLRLAAATNPMVAWRSTRAYLGTVRRRPKAPHHYLAILAVHPIAQGIGIGRTLLADLHRTCHDHPGSTGVALDTSNPANVGYYERFGYQVTQVFRTSGADVWCMWRPDI